MTDNSWEERWQAKRHEPLPAADPWLVDQEELLGSGIALDLACGRGRNSLWLAARGYEVFAVDSSLTALQLLKEANADQAAIHPIHFDLSSQLPAEPHQVDLVLCSYFLDRALFDQIKSRVEAGGLFIGRSFCQLGVMTPPADIIFNPGELAVLFADWEILRYEEGRESAKRGGTLAGIVARKPRST